MYYKKENPHGGETEKNILDFSASVNPLGPPKSVLDAAEKALEEIDRYPDPFAEDLLIAISEFEDVPKDSIVCGNGASEIVYSYCAAVKSETAIEIAPTFSEYEEGITLFGGKMKKYICREESGFIPSLDFMEAIDVSSEPDGPDSPDTIFICNPNNPTGRLLSKDFIREVLDKAEKTGAGVFIDECFMDLTESDWSSKEFLAEYKNLFILKSFTKTFAMPGLRLGYGICSDKNLLKRMADLVPPWNISSVAQRAGIAALEEKEYLCNAKKMVAEERDALVNALQERGFNVVPSEANFILFNTGDTLLAENLRAHRIAIRDCSNFEGLDAGWYRIAVRSPEENGKLIEALI